MVSKWNFVFTLISFSVFVGIVICDTTDELYQIGPMKVFRNNITLSGFSAGASMAIQTHMAHSSLFSGLAIFSQAFYHCGHRSLIEFGIRCSTTAFGLFPYSVSNSVDDAKEFSNSGLIDNLRNLADQRIFIWTGEQDVYIPSDMAAKNVDFYENVGVPPENIKFTLFANASHLIVKTPTENFGPPCNADAEESYYLGNCAYSGPYYALNYILNTELREAVPDTNQLKLYNQSAFYPGANIRDVAMGTKGFIYLPKYCENHDCLLHINFHGCYEWPPHIAKEYILNSGFLQIAEGSNIIMIFPLTTKVPQNMNGCWDFYSYTGANFATKKGAQIQVIDRMLQRTLQAA